MNKNFTRLDDSFAYLYKSRYRAREFVTTKISDEIIQSKDVGPASLLVDNHLGTGAKPEIYLSLYYAAEVWEMFSSMKLSQCHLWAQKEWKVWLLVVEEVSHFYYLVDSILRSVQLTHYDLEFRGEIDKFLLSYFLLVNYGITGTEAYGVVMERQYHQVKFLGTGAKLAMYEKAHFRSKELLEKNRALFTGVLPFIWSHPKLYHRLICGE